MPHLWRAPLPSGSDPPRRARRPRPWTSLLVVGPWEEHGTRDHHARMRRSRSWRRRMLSGRAATKIQQRRPSPSCPRAGRRPHFPKLCRLRRRPWPLLCYLPNQKEEDRGGREPEERGRHFGAGSKGRRFGAGTMAYQRTFLLPDDERGNSDQIRGGRRHS